MKKSIKFLLSITLILMTLILFAGQIAYMLTGFSRLQTKDVEETLRLSAENEANSMNTKFSQWSEAAYAYALSVESTSSYSDSSLFHLLQSQIAGDRFIVGGGFWLEPEIFKKGTRYYGPYLYKEGQEIKQTWDYSTEKYNYFQYDWYKNAMASDQKVVWSEPYADAVTKVMMITVSAPIKKNDVKIGVVTIDIGLDELFKDVRNIKAGGEGYGYILTEQGTYLGKKETVTDAAQKVSDEKEPQLKNLGEKIIGADKTGMDRVKMSNADYYVAYTPVGATGLKLVLAYPKAEADRSILRNVYSNVLMFAVTLALFVLLLHFILRRVIEKPLSILLENVKKIASGDLSEDEAVKKLSQSQNEIGMLAKAMHEMTGHIQEQAMVFEKISQGDLEVDIKQRSQKDEFSKNMLDMTLALKYVIKELKGLTEAANRGELQKRGDSARFKGVFGEIVLEYNNTLDAFVKPINEAKAVLEELAKGNLDTCVFGDYQGDYRSIKDSLNTTINTLKSYIKHISTVLGAIAEGNLDVSMDKEYHGDFRKVKESLKKILDSLNNVFESINLSSEQVATAANQIATASQVLSNGAMQQAGTVEQLTVTFEQIAGKTKRNAEAVHSANALVLSIRGNADDGNTKMREMLSAIESINQSSANITKVIKVIDEIAFQTNILAINAAVEAARVGQMGKGFAVVADEVRNLAARSAEAAKETEILIQGSIKSAEEGVKIAQETAYKLETIVSGVTKSVGIFDGIAKATEEQAIAIVEISHGVRQISDVTGENSATAQEVAASSEEMSGQSQYLKELIEYFKLGTVK